MSLQAQALAGFRWSAGLKVFSQVITWAITIFVIRLLTPADYGLLAMATVFVSFLTMFSELGLGAAVVQRAHVDDALLRRVLGVVLVLHVSLAAVLVLSAPLVAHFYDEPRVTPVLRALSLQFILAGFAVMPNAQLQRRMAFKNRALLDLFSALLASATTLALAWHGAGVWALVAGALGGQLCKTVGLNWLFPTQYWPELSFKGLRELLRFGGQFTAIQVFWVFLSQVDIVIAAKWLGHEALGFYSVATHFASLPGQRISSLVNQVAFAAFARLQDEGTHTGAHVLKGVRMLSFFAFPVLWGLSSVAPEGVAVVLGGAWAPAAFPLQVLALVIPLRIVGNFVNTALQGLGRSDVVLRNVLWATLIAPPAFLIGVNTWGLAGLSLAWWVVTPLVFLQGMLRGLPLLGLRWGQLVGAMAPAAGASLLMVGVVTATRHFAGGEPSSLWRLCALVAAGALTYGAVWWGLNRTGAQEVWNLLKNMATVKPQTT
jgi:O-antigen/teichoic acid export membrane protein